MRTCSDVLSDESPAFTVDLRKKYWCQTPNGIHECYGVPLSASGENTAKPRTTITTMSDSRDGFRYPTVDEINAIHEDIVTEGAETTPGTQDPRDVESALHYIKDGHYGEKPETIHEKAAHLLRLLVINHPYVDGNKRTALAATEMFYAMNGYLFRYDDGEIRSWLKQLATDVDAVDMDTLTTYCRDHATEIRAEE